MCKHLRRRVFRRRSLALALSTGLFACFLAISACSSQLPNAPTVPTPVPTESSIKLMSGPENGSSLALGYTANFAVSYTVGGGDMKDIIVWVCLSMDGTTPLLNDSCVGKGGLVDNPGIVGINGGIGNLNSKITETHYIMIFLTRRPANAPDMGEVLATQSIPMEYSFHR